MRTWMILGCVGLACLFPRPAWSQTLVTGQVTSAGTAVPQAEVLLEPHGIRTHTLENGTYLIMVPSRGPVRLIVRAVGFSPLSRRFILANSDTVRADFILERATQVLAPVEVEGQASTTTSRLAGFEERRRNRINNGQFFTRAELARRDYSPLSSVLRESVGIQLAPRRQGLGCGGGYAVASGRGPDRLSITPRELELLKCAGQTDLCYLSVYLDGALYWTPGTPGPPDIDAFRTNEMYGIEVYRGATQVPTQYRSLNSGCGVVLLWTRSAGS